MKKHLRYYSLSDVVFVYIRVKKLLLFFLIMILLCIHFLSFRVGYRFE